VATQVTMEDGTESPLVDHMRDAHQKGTRGYTEEYLANLHHLLHQRKREPEEELEHRHPEASDRDEVNAEVSGEPHTSGAGNGKHGKHRKVRT
jgi:hypothetical protein